MALIPLVEPAQNEYLADLERKGKRENRFFRMLARKPEVKEVFDASFLPPKGERELKALPK